jgi:hypothetical protein|tara:strand:+ start:480 stop:884 length:405 start_codon:yes stop_codon:yes gene_type:complete
MSEQELREKSYDKFIKIREDCVANGTTVWGWYWLGVKSQQAEIERLREVIRTAALSICKNAPDTLWLEDDNSNVNMTIYDYLMVAIDDPEKGGGDKDPWRICDHCKKKPSTHFLQKDTYLCNDCYKQMQKNCLT